MTLEEKIRMLIVELDAEADEHAEESINAPEEDWECGKLAGFAGAKTAVADRLRQLVEH